MQETLSLNLTFLKIVLVSLTAALTGMELEPTQNQDYLYPTEDWLQELIDDLGQPELTTPLLPTTTTTRPPRQTKRKGRRRKGKHRAEAPPPGPVDGAVRLAGDGHELGDRGRVEVYAGGAWGTVCDDLWTGLNAEVVCRQLGFRRALKAAKHSEFGQGWSLHILLDDVQCTGTEASLLDCKHAGLGTHNCDHHEDAGVVCGNAVESVVEV